MLSTLLIVIVVAPWLAVRLNVAGDPMDTPVVVQPLNVPPVTVTVIGNALGFDAETTRSPPAVDPFAVRPGYS
jgi:hypothetical protein